MMCGMWIASSNGTHLRQSRVDPSDFTVPQLLLNSCANTAVGVTHAGIVVARYLSDRISKSEKPRIRSREVRAAVMLRGTT
jgi:hypothetical protein